MKPNDQYLRMSDLANQPERKDKVYVTRSGRTRTIKAQSAKRGITGFSAKHIYHLINEGSFPAPRKIGRASVWRMSEINKWLDSHDHKED